MNNNVGKYWFFKSCSNFYDIISLGDFMKFKNPYMRKIKNTHLLLVSCNLCKTPLLIYQKGGRGNLIKIQRDRIVELEFDIDEMGNGLYCINCGEHLGSLRDYFGVPSYFLIRGLVNSRRI